MLYNCSNKGMSLFCVSIKYYLIAASAPTPAFTQQMTESIVYFVCLSLCFFACHYVGKSKRLTGEKRPVEKPSEGGWMI